MVLFAVCVFAGVASSQAADAVAGGATPTVSAAASSASGRVSGRVRYVADPARPWRFGRFYIASAKDGWLSEAVVALEAPGLAGPAVAPQTLHVDQRNFNFTPETAALRAGDSIRFTNSDEALHNVLTFEGGSSFNVNLTSGQEHTHRFDEGKGLDQPIHLTCVFHGAMRAWIYVFPHPFFGLTGKDGAFRFENVPPGNYVLRLVHPAGGLEWQQSVTVKASGSTQLDVSLTPDQKRDLTSP